MSERVRTVAIMVEVRDAEALRWAAEQRALRDGLERDSWRETRANGDAIGNDLRMLLDPGGSVPPGISIIESSCD